jgi:hypothetical protein
MSAPVREAEGPLSYAPRWARTPGGGNESNKTARTPVPVRELAPEPDFVPPRIVMPLRNEPSVREAAPVREPAPVRAPAPVRDLATARDISPTRENSPIRDAIPARPARDAASVPPTSPLLPSKSLSPFRALANLNLPDVVDAQESDLPWKRKKRPPIFEGDAAIKELRARLAMAPDQMPEPPLYRVKDPIFAVVARLMGVMALAAAGAVGFLWITATPHAAAPESAAGGEPALASNRAPETSRPQPAAETARAERAPESPNSRASWSVADYARDLTDGVGTQPVAPPTRSFSTPPAPRVSAPAPAPRVVAPPPVMAAPAAPPAQTPPAPASQAPAHQVAAAPALPRAVAPAVETPVVVAVAAPPSTSVSALDREEVAALLARARTYISSGDVAAARLVLRRAAERDDAQAALALGGTYDPVVLKRLGVINFHADAAQAREWYQRAANLGSADASARLEQLAQAER